MQQYIENIYFKHFLGHFWCILLLKENILSCLLMQHAKNIQIDNRYVPDCSSNIAHIVPASSWRLLYFTHIFVCTSLYASEEKPVPLNYICTLTAYLSNSPKRLMLYFTNMLHENVSYGRSGIQFRFYFYTKPCSTSVGEWEPRKTNSERQIECLCKRICLYDFKKI